MGVRIRRSEVKKGIKKEIISDLRRYSDKLRDDGKTINKYDTNGNLVENSHYPDSDGSLSRKYIYKYDSNGKLVEELDYYEGYLEDKRIYKYDSNGNMVEMLRWNMLSEKTRDYPLEVCSPMTFIYKYDSNGNEVECLDYDSDGSYTGRSINKYDTNGNKVEWSTYDSEGSSKGKYIYKYDSNGNMIELRRYKSDGLLWSYDTYKYNSEGKKVVEDRYFTRLGELPVESHHYKYDSNGNEVESLIWDKDDDLGMTNKYISKYDTKNRIIELKGIEVKELIGKYHFKGDKPYKKTISKTTYEYEEY